MKYTIDTEFKPGEKINVLIDHEINEYMINTAETKIIQTPGFERVFTEYTIAGTSVLERNDYLRISEFDLKNIVR